MRKTIYRRYLTILAITAVACLAVMVATERWGEAPRVEVPPKTVLVKADKVRDGGERGKVVRVKERGKVWRVKFRGGQVWRLTPCKREDSRNCYWDAQVRGNGKGKSFVNVRGDHYRVKRFLSARSSTGL